MGCIRRIVGLFLGVLLLAERARCQHVKNNVPRLKLSYKGKPVFLLGLPGIFRQDSALCLGGFALLVPDSNPLLLLLREIGEGTVSLKTKEPASIKAPEGS